MGCKPYLVWLPRKIFKDSLTSAQVHFDKCPKTYGPFHELNYSMKGAQHTLKLLKTYDDKIECQAAVLISASLAMRFGDRQAGVSEYWPNRYSIKLLSQKSDDVWGGNVERWHHAMTQMLRVYFADYAYKITTLPGLIRYLAEEHPALLLRYVPTQVSYVDSPAVRQENFQNKAHAKIFFVPLG